MRVGEKTMLNDPPQRSFRRSLRKHMTPAERTLWYKLRSRRLLGHKFRRQTSIGKYIVDFYCSEKKLILEVDGEIHGLYDRPQRDSEREAFLQSLGFRILRFTNYQVRYFIDSVLERILQELE